MHAEEGKTIGDTATVEEAGLISEIFLARCILEASKILSTESCPHPECAAIQVDDFPAFVICNGGVLRTETSPEAPYSRVKVTTTDKHRQTPLLLVGMINSGMGMILEDCCLCCALTQMKKKKKMTGEDQYPLSKVRGWVGLMLC